MENSNIYHDEDEIGGSGESGSDNGKKLKREWFEDCGNEICDLFITHVVRVLDGCFMLVVTLS
jgi:hypothetical protein